MAATGYVEKTGTNQKQGYKYVTEADVLAMLRKELAIRQVFVFPSVVSTERTPLYTTNSGNTMLGTDVMVKWTFLDGETGETQECMMPGCGADTGDKGLYKAITGSSKYMFLKAFLLPTGDDPEDEKPDFEEGKKAAQQVAEKKLADYAEKAVSSVKDKIVHIYPHRLGDVEVMVFMASEALALLLENGLKDVTQYSDTLRARWIVNDPAVLPMLDTVAQKLGVTIQLIPNPGQEGVTKAAIPPPASLPLLTEAVEKPTKTGVCLSVVWGGNKYNCFHKHLWDALKAGANAKQPAELLTEKNGKYTNVVGIERIGAREFIDDQPVRNVNDFGDTPFF